MTDHDEPYCHCCGATAGSGTISPAPIWCELYDYLCYTCRRALEAKRNQEPEEDA